MAAGEFKKALEVDSIKHDYDIVAIDDDSLELQIMLRSLRNSPYEVACFLNVEEALAFLSTQQPHILMVDYRMPGLDGIAFIEKLTEIYDISGMSIYLTSGSQVPQQIAAQAKELGVQFIEKDEMSEKGYLENLCANAIKRQAQNQAA